MEDKIKSLGWYWDLWGAGGWTHDDVRDDDGYRIVFGEPQDVAEYLGLEEPEKS